ncbi:hypothetical protein BGW38_001750 [Lunasporangiospora selenospora]|uniref:MULE transposase domain-containing protein n=1 Tax=Lunasporangiospora selenospora TaxID=979761 RepID=A0A9P6KDX9_9FUNG|nr:hypothetical protein BGW38_001750 [Lunasporangiospora selenospora]
MIELVGTGCKAHVRIQKPIGKDCVAVEYYWKHNHGTSMSDRARLPLGANESNINKGLDWKGIQKRLIPSEDSLCSDVHGVFYRRQMREAARDKDIFQSIHLWIKDIKMRGGEGMFQFETKDKERSHKNSSWSSHKVVRPLMPNVKKIRDVSALFTILVKDVVLQKGIPIAYLICSSESTFLLKKWLSWLKDTCRFRVSKFMMDCSPIETEAVQAIFPQAVIYYCLFHVAQIWERRMRKDCNKEHWYQMGLALKAIRGARSNEELDGLWQKFKVAFPGTERFCAFLERNWLARTKREKWVLFVRENYQHVDTNNLLEFWFHTLNSNYLDGRCGHRVDVVMFMLQGEIERDFKTQLVKVDHGVQPVKQSEYD